MQAKQKSNPAVTFAIAAGIIFLFGLFAGLSGCEGELKTKGGAYLVGEDLRLYTRSFSSEETSRNPRLVVVLHGDAPRNDPDYQYVFARKVARENKDVVVVAILRPGYRDPDGNQSEGSRGMSVGDNWNRANTDAVAAVIAKLRDEVQARAVLVAGHSGGASMTANILGTHPDLIDGALLVSCACDAEAWRAHMFAERQYEPFREPIPPVSAMDHLPHISSEVLVSMVVGEEDNITPPSLSEVYYEAGLALDKNMRLASIADQGHEIFFHRVVHKELTVLLEALP